MAVGPPKLQHLPALWHTHKNHVPLEKMMKLEPFVHEFKILEKQNDQGQSYHCGAALGIAVFEVSEWATNWALLLSRVVQLLCMC